MPDLTLWTIRLSALLYVAALTAWLYRRPAPARLLWTAGCLLFLAHAAAAFHFHHHWSHAAAYRETARQTAARFGVPSGSGIYWNYAFTILWTLDVLWLWRARHPRPLWISAALHTFFAFLFFNGVIVFGRGLTRTLGIAATLFLLSVAARTRTSRRASTFHPPPPMA